MRARLPSSASTTNSALIWSHEARADIAISEPISALADQPAQSAAFHGANAAKGASIMAALSQYLLGRPRKRSAVGRRTLRHASASATSRSTCQRRSAGANNGRNTSTSGQLEARHPRRRIPPGALCGRCQLEAAIVRPSQPINHPPAGRPEPRLRNARVRYGRPASVSAPKPARCRRTCCAPVWSATSAPIWAQRAICHLVAIFPRRAFSSRALLATRPPLYSNSINLPASRAPSRKRADRARPRQAPALANGKSITWPLAPTAPLMSPTGTTVHDEWSEHALVARAPHAGAQFAIPAKLDPARSNELM